MVLKSLRRSDSQHRKPDLGPRFDKMLLSAATALWDRVIAGHGGAAKETVRSRKYPFLIQQITSELRRFFPVGVSEPTHLFIYVY